MCTDNGASRDETISLREHERIVGRYEKQVFDLKQLIRISNSLNSTLDYSTLIESMLYTCMGQMKVLKAGVFTRKDVYRADLWLHRTHIGFDIDHSVEYMIPEHHELLHHLSRNFDIFALDEMRALLGGEHAIPCIEQLAPSLIVPLRAKNVINGLIVLGERIGVDGQFTFSESEKEYLRDIAVLAGIAVHNAFLYEVTTTDMMTRLKLRHYFQNTLIEAIEAAAQNDRPLSVIMIDIDHFKRLNDTHGHVCGDQVLRAVADVIRNSVRQTDLAARYGGEEFVILCPDTDIATARVIGERIRAAIVGMETNYNDTAISVTVSLGVAQYDDIRDRSSKTFVDRADKALYRSKRSGRNRVSIAA